MSEGEYRTSRDVTLWYGRNGPTTLPAGTTITVLDHDAHVVRFVYPGIDAEWATADVDLVAELAPTRQVPSEVDEDTAWRSRRTSEPSSGSPSCGDAHASNGSTPRSRSSIDPARKTAGASSGSWSGPTPSSNGDRSNSSSSTTSARRRSVPDIG